MKLSIITPSLNRCGYLRQTMHSVLSQTGAFDLQWIVIDGGSTDGTVELLGSLDDPRLRWISEPDGGQSAAINKGLRLADGDIVAWLNSDDLYTPGTLDAVAKAFQQNPRAQWLAGRCQIINARNKIIRRGLTAYKDRHLRYYRYQALLRENMLCQPAIFWRRPFGQEVGLLDETLEYTMDYELWLRMGRRCNPLFLDRVLACFRLYPQSKSGRVSRAQFDEEYLVACRYFNHDHASRLLHRFNVEKIIWAYRFMGWIGY